LFRQAYFFQDRWRPTDSLTLTLGVRYENFGTPMNSVSTAAWSGLFNIDPVTFDGPYRLPNKVQADNNNWSPMIGLAYSPTKTDGLLGKVFGIKRGVIRMGYGIGYDSFFNNIASNAQGSVPNVIATSFSSQVNAANPRGSGNLFSTIPTTARAPQPVDAQALSPGDMVNPYYQRWSAGFQRELPGNLLFDISHVGSQGVKLFINEQLNPTVPSSLRVIPATSTPILSSRLQPRLDALQGSRNIRTNGGGSSYHSLQTSLHRRFTDGLSGSVAYTWSRLIDNASDIFSTTGVNQTQNPTVPAMFAPGGLRFGRAVSLFDRTHRAAFTLVYDLPWFSHRRDLLGQTLGGWQFSTVTAFETGVPLNVTNGLDADGYDGTGDRPNFNPNGTPGVRAVPSSSSSTGYVNPDASNAPIDPATAMYIALPAQSGANPAPTGNLGRNTLRSPGIANFDVNVQKQFLLTERFRLELRTEFYNIFNHPQFGTPSVSPFSPAEQGISASVATSAAGRFLVPNFADGGGRVIRYQLKLRF